MRSTRLQAITVQQQEAEHPPLGPSGQETSALQQLAANDKALSSVRVAFGTAVALQVAAPLLAPYAGSFVRQHTCSTRASACSHLHARTSCAVLVPKLHGLC